MTGQPTPSRRTGLRNEIARVIHRYDCDHMLSRNDIPSKHHRGEADAVLALLYREWPWLRAEAEETESAATEPRVTALYEQWVKAGPPPLGASMARWWDMRLAELHRALTSPAEQPARTTPNNPPTSKDNQ